MEIKFTAIAIILIIGVVQGLFLTLVLLISKKGNTKANRFLALFILTFSLLTIGDILYNTRLLYTFPHLFLVFDPLLFLLAPLCYLYVRVITNPAWRFDHKLLLHFIPTILLYSLFSMVYLLDAHSKQNIIQDSYRNPDESADFLLIIAAMQILTYFMIIIRLLKAHALKIKDYFSYHESINLKWLKNFIIINSVLWIAFTISSIYKIEILINISNLLFPVAVYVIGYFGLHQPEIFFYNPADNSYNENDQNLIARKKYANSPLSEELEQQYVTALLKLMPEELLYLQNDLKLSDVALRLSLPSHHLSQVLNKKLGKNFNDFVNEYRVDEFKKRLLDKKYHHLTILAIGLDSGFNSKAALNNVFKKHTGLSPSDYKKKRFLN